MSVHRGDAGAFALMDDFRSLPMPGEYPPLDEFLASKNITQRALARTGAMWHNEWDDCLVWCQTKDYVKLRWFAGPNSKDPKKTHQTKWGSLKAPPSAHIMAPRNRDADPAGVLLIPEGQTDAARMWEMYPTASVAVLLVPLVPQKLPAIASGFKRVLICTDADEGGEDLARRLMAAIPGSSRFAPPVSA